MTKYTGPYFITDAYDPDVGIPRCYGGARTVDRSVEQCKIQLAEYLGNTRRWSYWKELPLNGFRLETTKVQ